jgi:hypothetical protein
MFWRNVGLRGGPAPVRAYLPDLLDRVLSGRIDPRCLRRQHGLDCASFVHRGVGLGDFGQGQGQVEDLARNGLRERSRSEAVRVGACPVRPALEDSRWGRPVCDTLNLCPTSPRGVSGCAISPTWSGGPRWPSSPWFYCGQMERTYTLGRERPTNRRPLVVDLDKLAYAARLRDTGHRFADIVAKTSIARTCLPPPPGPQGRSPRCRPPRRAGRGRSPQEVAALEALTDRGCCAPHLGTMAGPEILRAKS